MINKRELLTLSAWAGAMVGVGGSAVALESDVVAAPEETGDIVLVYRGIPSRAVEWNVNESDSLGGPVSKTIDMLVDCELQGVEVTHIELSERAFRYLRHKDLIDCIRRSNGELVMRTFLGYQMCVPGTAVALQW